MCVCPSTCADTLSFIHAEADKIGKGTVMLPTSLNECQNIYLGLEGKTIPEIGTAVSCESVLNHLHFITHESFLSIHFSLVLS